MQITKKNGLLDQGTLDLPFIKKITLTYCLDSFDPNGRL